LPLPSSLPPTCLTDTKFSTLLLYEFRLRVGHAYDLLASVRMSVRKKAALIADKDRNARGTKDNLRSQELIRGVHQRTLFLAGLYNSNLNLMEVLAASSPPPSTWSLPPNLRSIDVTKDLNMSGLVAARNLGDSKRTLSWIFRVCGPEAGGAEDGAAWEEETKRTDWFRAWAAKTRTDEEVNLLVAEARALRRGFAFASRLHRECSGALPLYASAGATAYALEKAAMYQDMSDE
ncbi:hypothetical protein L226DRAFT_445192, partial [Lentinus tigrinus ALCF2SS1-7]|uniref:uncharacterized protein n=1 Tax=Lentinus tigrinus ALCF2SS1-7 TaxID=1328758 RepID=UPI001165EB06